MIVLQFNKDCVEIMKNGIDVFSIESKRQIFVKVNEGEI